MRSVQNKLVSKLICGETSNFFLADMCTYCKSVTMTYCILNCLVCVILSSQMLEFEKVNRLAPFSIAIKVILV